MRKKPILFIVVFFACFYIMQSQTLVSTNVEKKNAVLEEFTGIHCQYCPDGHAIAQNLYNNNPYDVVLINIHTGGYAIPGSGEPDYRTTFGDGIAAIAGITGYPSGTVNRYFFSDLSMGSGTAMGRGAWETAANRMFIEDSPVNVGASTSYNDGNRELTVNVELYYTSDAPTSSNYINVALVQNNIIGPQQDGGTWVTDYEHNHMLRDMITGQWGDEVVTTTQGTFIQRTYIYTIPDEYTSIPCIVENCDVAVFVSEDQQEEIYSGVQIPAIDGTTYVIGTFTNPATSIQAGSTGNTNTFEFDFTNGFPTDEDFTFTLEKYNEPGDWNSSFSIGGSTYTQTGTLTVTGDATEPVSIDITPGAAAGYIKYRLTAESVTYPDYQKRTMDVFIIANVGTLLFHNNGSWSTGSPVDFEDEYFAGFDYASVTDYTSCSYPMFIMAVDNNLIDNIHTLFYNVAWTFPGINEEITAILTPFLDNGGNLFIAGQDLGWDTWENTGTTVTQSFYTNYLNADYQADGSTANNSLYPNPNDGVFGDLNSSSLVNIYGGTNMYPDEMSAVGYGSVILRYLNNPSKGAAVKATNGDYKVVYLGFDPPMVSDVTVRNEIIKRSIDWFNGVLAPNVIFTPADGSTNVPVSTTVTISFDQGIRNLDDSEITNGNISNIVTFEDASLNSVAFTGVINAEKTQITITPDADLEGLTGYTVTITDFENDNNVAGETSSTTFTTEQLIGINSGNINSVIIHPNPANDFVTVQTLIGSKITVQDISGKIVYSGLSSDVKQEIDVSNFAEGLYFIKIYFNNESVSKKLVIAK